MYSIFYYWIYGRQSWSSWRRCRLRIRGLVPCGGGQHSTHSKLELEMGVRSARQVCNAHVIIGRTYCTVPNSVGGWIELATIVLKGELNKLSPAPRGVTHRLALGMRLKVARNNTKQSGLAGLSSILWSYGYGSMMEKGRNIQRTMPKGMGDVPFS